MIPASAGSDGWIGAEVTLGALAVASILAEGTSVVEMDAVAEVASVERGAGLVVQPKRIRKKTIDTARSTALL